MTELRKSTSRMSEQEKLLLLEIKRRVFPVKQKELYFVVGWNVLVVSLGQFYLIVLSLTEREA